MRAAYHPPPCPTAFPKTPPECRPAPTFVILKWFLSKCLQEFISFVILPGRAGESIDGIMMKTFSSFLDGIFLKLVLFLF